MTRKTSAVAGKRAALPAGYAGIHGGIVELLDSARQAAARSVNALMTTSYWEIGRRIVEAEQKGRRRAGYGEQLMARLSADLTARFGRGFRPDNLENMRRFFVAYAVGATSETLSRKFNLSEFPQVFTLPWSAYVRLLSVKETMPASSTRPRCSPKPDDAIKGSDVLELLNLKDEYSESDPKQQSTSGWWISPGAWQRLRLCRRQRRLRIGQTWYRVGRYWHHSIKPFFTQK